ncbi:long-chain fatty acid--CoA ligase [Noviherbaspirillum galbum]|uniref:Long-chain fatty acid--CoA ligase n=1 Tax=Noviherbaspirillum galbum TaxID=2709383 RepID=A0A6B3SWE6_9BURK|nr:long-chain fatty acid--CoA ligase [Noviherbaspirillum galbum]NEX64831.1 long-chain fatty acid--CoA ligase [Noviherbaspirillum galbum]
MSTLHHRYWPKGFPKTLHVPDTSLVYNLEVAARRYPDKPALVFYDTVLSYAELKREVDALAGFLQQRFGIRKGDRVLLMSQNCPQFVVAYYAVMRADAVVVPVNAMSTTRELAHYAADSGARTAIVAQELWPAVTPLLGRDGKEAIDHALVLRYGDYLRAPTELNVPDVVREAPAAIAHDRAVSWNAALAAACVPAPHLAGKDDICLLPYTSGTTGLPKGCIHTHGTLMAVAANSQAWRQLFPSSVFFASAPAFHLLGMQNGMNIPILLGATALLLTRWDRDNAASLMSRYGATAWAAPPAMVLDFFARPDLDRYDLSSLTLITGGGAAMPEAVALMLREKYGLEYIEAYGMTETASGTHANPLWRPKRQCLGMPVFGVDSRVVDPTTLDELPQGQVGEIVTHGPQVMKGYWNNEPANREVFFERDGKRFIRTGDLGYVDEDGYFFMCDRLKRMINVSGYKVWPAEVENMMYSHPSIHEACVVGMQDERRGESVKAILVVKPESKGNLSEGDVIAWCRGQMATYKVPRAVEFVDALPKSSTGKILWRELQEKEKGSVSGVDGR